jgi:hypothetical protein
MKPHTEMIEGPEAFTRFHGAMAKVLTVSNDEMKRRIDLEFMAAAGHSISNP